MGVIGSDVIVLVNVDEMTQKFHPEKRGWKCGIGEKRNLNELSDNVEPLRLSISGFFSLIVFYLLIRFDAIKKTFLHSIIEHMSREVGLVGINSVSDDCIDDRIKLLN